MPIRSLAGRIVAAAVVVAAAVLSPVTPAAADEGEPIMYTPQEGAKYHGVYDDGMLPPGDAGGEFHDPDGCASVPFCTLIPIHMQMPAGYDPDFDEFVITLTVDWDDNIRVPGAAGVNGQGNDLDVYVYYGEKQPDEEGELQWVEYDHVATSQNPEVLKMFQTDDPLYYLVVSNYSGYNASFTVDLTYQYHGVPRDDGSVAPGVRPRPGSGGSSAGAGSTGSGADAPAPVTATPSFTPSSPAFAPLGPALTPDLGPGGSFGSDTGSGDDSFAAAFPGGFKALDGDLQAGGPGVDLLAAQNRKLGPPEPVSGATIAFWLGLVPLLVLGAAAVLVIRRRPAALTLPVPTPSGGVAQPA